MGAHICKKEPDLWLEPDDEAKIRKLFKKYGEERLIIAVRKAAYEATTQKDIPDHLKAVAQK